MKLFVVWIVQMTGPKSMPKVYLKNWGMASQPHGLSECHLRAQEIFGYFKNEAVHIPQMTPVSPMIVLAPTLSIAQSVWPFRSNWIVSKPKAEYVVNDPRKPTAKNRKIDGNRLWSRQNSNNNPIAKQPATFISSVEIGNGCVKNWRAN